MNQRTTIIHRKISSLPTVSVPAAVEDVSTRDSWTALPLPSSPSSPRPDSPIPPSLDAGGHRMGSSRLQFRSPSPSESLADELQYGSLCWLRQLVWQTHHLLTPALLCQYVGVMEVPIRAFAWLVLYNVNFIGSAFLCIVLTLGSLYHWAQCQYFWAVALYESFDDVVQMWDFKYPFSLSELNEGASMACAPPAIPRIPSSLLYLIPRLYCLGKFSWRQWLASPRIMTDFALWLHQNPIDFPLTSTELSWWVRKSGCECHSMAFLVLDTIDLESLRHIIFQRMVLREPKLRSVVANDHHWRVLPLRGSVQYTNRSSECPSLSSLCSPCSDSPNATSRCCSTPQSLYSSQLSAITPSGGSPFSTSSTDTPWDLFDIAWHVVEKYVVCGDETVPIGPQSITVPVAVFEELSNWDAEPLARDEPLWKVLLIKPVSTEVNRDLRTRGSYIAFKFHQALCDGQSLVRMIGRDLADPQEDGAFSGTVRQVMSLPARVAAHLGHLWKASNILFEWGVWHPRAISVLQTGKQIPAQLRTVEYDDSSSHQRCMLMPPVSLSCAAVRTICRRLQALFRCPFEIDDVVLLCLMQLLSDLRLGRGCDIIQKLGRDEDWQDIQLSSATLHRLQRELAQIRQGLFRIPSNLHSFENIQTVLMPCVMTTDTPGTPYPWATPLLATCSTPTPHAFSLVWGKGLSVKGPPCRPLPTPAGRNNGGVPTVHWQLDGDSPMKLSWSLFQVLEVKAQSDEAKMTGIWDSVYTIIHALCTTLPSWAASLLLHRFSSRVATTLINITGPDVPVQIEGRRAKVISLWAPAHRTTCAAFTTVSYLGALELSVSLNYDELHRFAPALAMIPFAQRLHLAQQMFPEHFKEKLSQLDSLSHALASVSGKRNSTRSCHSPTTSLAPTLPQSNHDSHYHHSLHPA